MNVSGIENESSRDVRNHLDVMTMTPMNSKKLKRITPIGTFKRTSQTQAIRKVYPKIGSQKKSRPCRNIEFD
ncbi:unnamed protein product [Caenorhabditis bovis]|uniref:Uncharacterized protein n=1 Tax=Caenorhabditis bovis TaxID=2654633 RepID=A0A8S1F475_9PELO|nr:unnamed protein product [Caenorhabditis bovis]